jgi:UDP-N-acetylmuramoylalanine--D-glutamate ligase
LFGGLGVTGLASVEFALRQGYEVLAIDQRLPLADAALEQLKRLKLEFGNVSWDEQSRLGDLATIQETSLILLSPGIPREHLLLRPYWQKNTPIINEIEWAAKLFKHPIIAITGSNGKTTTTLLVEHLLKGLGLKVFAGGNLGRPFVDLFNKNEQVDVAVLELSSFQLESLFEFTADSSAILNLSFTHGERYADVQLYAKAKLRLVERSHKIWLCSEEFVDSDEVRTFWREAHQKSSAKTLLFSVEQLREIYDLSQFTLLGHHNLMNLWSATCLILDIYPEQRDRLRHALAGFSPPEHRLEPVLSQIPERLLVNDSKATNWKAAATALAAFKGQENEILLILGGKCRGMNDSILPFWQEFHSRFKSIALYGESAKLHLEELISLKEEARVLHSCYELEGLLLGLRDLKTPKIWVFSPGFPSFDQFSNYEDRGRKFKQYSRDLSL